MLKKAILSILASLVVFFSFAPYLSVVNAQGATPPPPSWYNSDFQSWYSKVYDNTNPNEIFGERYTAAQVQWIIYGMFAFLLNSTTNAEVTSCLLKNSANIDACKDLLVSTYSGPSNLATVETEQPSLMSLVFEGRSFSGISYVKNQVQNFSLVPTANAQSAGFGFDALVPIQEMWRASRDMAFGLFVIAAIIFSFMIMFRVKISPQVVISVQSAIPKLIISLILVTFSYAIAGLLIDLMYVVYGIISVVGKDFAIANQTPSAIFQFLTKGQLLGLGGSGPDLGVFGLYVVYLIAFAITFVISVFYTLGLVGVALGVALGIFAASVPILGILGILILIIAIIMLIVNGFKIFFALLKAYVNILLLTIFAPIQIVLGTLIPNFGFGAWLKSYVSNLAVFVTASVLFYFAFIFLGLALSAPFTRGLLESVLRVVLGTVAADRFFVGSPGWPPLFSSGEGWLSLLYCGASFLIFNLIPKSTEVVQGLISGRPFAYGTAIGEALGPAYERTIGPGVKSLEKYGAEKRTVELLTRIDNAISKSPYGKYVPQGVKDFVSEGSQGKPQPFH